jgi:hypothetical protein
MLQPARGFLVSRRLIAFVKHKQGDAEVFKQIIGGGASQIHSASFPLLGANTNTCVIAITKSALGFKF